MPSARGTHNAIRSKRWRVAAAVLVLLLAAVSLTEATGITRITGTVIRLFKPDGTLVVEVDDPAVKVTIDGEDIVIHGAGPQEVRLKAGIYKLKATRDGAPVKLSTELVTISRGGKQVVRVSVEPGQGQAAKGLGTDGAADWVKLFNGKDLTGWKTHPDQPGHWKVEDGELTGSTEGGPISHLYTERGDFTDFHLRVEAKINKGGDSGVHFRSSSYPEFDLKVHKAQGKQPLGYEANIWKSTPPNVGGVGSLWQLGPNGKAFYKPGFDVPIEPDTWFTLEILMRGNHIVTKVNGKAVVDYRDGSSSHTKGHFALQAMYASTRVHFRKIEIKELLPSNLAAQPFVILPKNNKIEEKFATLADAVTGAQSGDTIEIRGDGPFVTEPIKITRKALTIRAGDGYRPHLRLRPEGIDQHMLSTDAALVLEGLTLEVTGKREFGDVRGVIFASGRSLQLLIVTCWDPTVTAGQPFALEGVPVCSMQNCIFGSGHAGITLDLPRKARYVLDNNVIHAADHGVFVHQNATDVEDVSIRLRNNTILSNLPINFGFVPALDKILAERPNPEGSGLRLEASGNILDSAGPFSFSARTRSRCLWRRRFRCCRVWLPSRTTATFIRSPIKLSWSSTGLTTRNPCENSRPWRNGTSSGELPNRPRTIGLAQFRGRRPPRQGLHFARPAQPRRLPPRQGQPRPGRRPRRQGPRRGRGSRRPRRGV